MADLASLSLALPDADCLLVVPPAARLNWPALGVHQLQACGREAGFEVAVLYMNVLFGALVGAKTYADLSIVPTDWLIGERLFSRAAWGAPPLGFETDTLFTRLDNYNAGLARAAQAEAVHPSDVAWKDDDASPSPILRDDLLGWEALAFDLAGWLAQAIAAKGYAVVGATTSFDQTSAALSVLSRVKALRPATRTILGGANCEGEMAQGVRSVAKGAVDHVFSGESEPAFVRFLQDVRDGREPEGPVVNGTPCTDLDALPTPRFDEYFAQLDAHPGLSGVERWVTYEASRGCWWGAKHHCTFCGFNAMGMGFREKSPDRVVHELRQILDGAPTRRIQMTDNIMPWRYHASLVPRIPREVGEAYFFYEQKANLTLPQVKNMWDAGMAVIQAGVEAMDTELTKLMRKGVFARQNVALLRYARVVGMKVQWNLLWGMPGDSEAPYRRTLDLLPRLRHLCPPYMLTHLIIDRYSPYHSEAAAFGITDLEPLDCYAGIYPPGADLQRLAYHFQGKYPSGSHDAIGLMSELNREIGRWQEAWRGDPRQRPALVVRRVGPGRYALVDTRGLGKAPMLYLDEAQARAVLVGGPRDKVPRAAWAIDNLYAADLDGWCAPLAVAPYPLLAELEGMGEAAPAASAAREATRGEGA